MGEKARRGERIHTSSFNSLLKQKEIKQQLKGKATMVDACVTIQDQKMLTFHENKDDYDSEVSPKR